MTTKLGSAIFLYEDGYRADKSDYEFTVLKVRIIIIGDQCINSSLICLTLSVLGHYYQLHLIKIYTSWIALLSSDCITYLSILVYHLHEVPPCKVIKEFSHQNVIIPCGSVLECPARDSEVVGSNTG